VDEFALATHRLQSSWFAKQNPGQRARANRCGRTRRIFHYAESV